MPPLVLFQTHEVLQLGEHRLAGSEQLAHVAPVHADKRDGAVAHDAAHVAEGLGQECGECASAHLARGQRELAVLIEPRPQTWPSIGTL